MPPTDARSLLSELVAWAAAHPRANGTSTHHYGAHPEQVADLVLPDGPGPHPLAVLLHGGFWRAEFDRTLMTAMALDLADRGWASWNVEYRRVGNGGGVPATLDDVAAAIAAGKASGDTIDPARVVVLGHSAGGQLALCAAAGAGVTAVVSLAGVCDLAGAARDGLGDGAALAFVGGTPDERHGAYALADPLALLPTGVPVLLVHGDRDDRVPVGQSRRYAEAARAAGDRCELLELAGVGHFAPIDPRTGQWQVVAERLEPMCRA